MMNKIFVIAVLLLSAAWTVAQTAPPASGTAPAAGQATPGAAVPAQSSQGQTAAAPGQAPAGADQALSAPVKNPVAAALKEIFPGRQKNTIEAVEAMPADKFTYKPSPSQVTFAHLVAHMVDANYVLCAGAADVPIPKFEAVTEFVPKTELVEGLKKSFDFCSDALSKMDDSKLGEMAPGPGPGGQKLSRARFALGIASNWADHYAEAAMYLRQNNILPPTAKKDH